RFCMAVGAIQSGDALPSVSLSEVLQLALPAGSSALAGADHLDRRVHWARLLRARPAGLVEPGELLLLPVGLLDSLSDSRVVPRVLAELIEAGVSAFVVSSPHPEAVLAACTASGTPLFEVPREVALADVERSIVALILDRDSQLRRRAGEVYGRLLAGMLGNAGLDALVDALAEALDLRVAVFDDSLSLRAQAPDADEFRRAILAAARGML